MEIWQTTIESDRYEVSNYGNIRNKFKTKNVSLRKQANYLYWGRMEQSKFKKAYVHRTVYQSFKGEIPIGYDINHINFNSNDNNINNLEAVSHIDNLNHSRKAGRYLEANKKHSEWLKQRHKDKQIRDAKKNKIR